jgi:hypothetical protein
MEMEKMKMQKRNRLLSTLLALALMLSLLPVSAFAAESATITGLDTITVADYAGMAEKMGPWLDEQTAPVTVTAEDGTTVTAQALGYYAQDVNYNSLLTTEDSSTLYSDTLTYFLAVAAIPEGEAPDLQPMGLMAMRTTYISYPANAMNLTGGHGKCQLLFLLYKVTGERFFSQSFDLVQQWTGGAFQVDARKITFEGLSENRVVFVPQGGTCDLTAGITAHDETGTPVDVFLSDDGGFSTDTVGKYYTVVYGAIDPRTNEPAMAGQGFEITAGGVYFNPYGQAYDDTSISAFCDTLGTETLTSTYKKIFKADDTLPDRLRSYFVTADGKQIDPELVTLTDDGGYTTNVTENTDYKLTYGVDSVTGGETVTKAVTVTVHPSTAWQITMGLPDGIRNMNLTFLSTNTEAQNTQTYTTTTGDTSFWIYQWLRAGKSEADMKSVIADNGMIWLYRSLGGGTNAISETNTKYYNSKNASSYSDTYNFSLSAGYAPQKTSTLIGKAFDINVDDGGFDVNTPGKYTITLTLVKDGETKVTGIIKVNVVGIAVSAMSFAGVDDAFVILGTDTDLMAGVSAVSKAGVPLTVTLKNDGGFDKDKAGDYTVTYAAELDGKEYTAAKVFHVRDKTPTDENAKISLTLDEKNAFGTDPNDFGLGKLGQENLTFLLEYDGAIASTSRTVSATIPYGFELIQPLPPMTVANLKAVVTGDYNQPGGTTFTYTIPNGAQSQILLQFQTKVHLELLYPGLSETAAENRYTFSASARVNAYPVKSSSVTLQANRTSQMPELTVDISDNALCWTPTDLFGYPVYKSVPYYGARAYSITVTKTPGTLSAPDWNMVYTLPDGLTSKSLGMYNYYMTFYDQNDAVLGMITGDTTSATFSGEQVKLNLFNAKRFTFDDLGNGGTYMDMNEKTAKIVVKFYFDYQPSGENKNLLKINTTSDLSAAGDQGDMIGSEVTISQTDRDGSGITQAKSDGKITIRLLAPATNVQLREATAKTGFADTTIEAGSRNGSYKSFLFDAGTNTGPGDALRNASVTTEWPYEYGPYSVYKSSSVDLSDYTVTYTVSNKDGVVKGKENLTYYTRFQLDDGEYVSSTTVANSGKDKTSIDSADWPGSWNGDLDWLKTDNPIFYCAARNTHLDGSAITAETTVQLKITGTAEQIAAPLTAVKKIIITPKPALKYNMQISPCDQSGYKSVIGPLARWYGSYGGSYDCAMAFEIKTNSDTETYKDAAVYLTGPALAMANPARIGNDYDWNTEIKVLAYSIDPKATTSGGGTWVTDPYKLAVAKVSNFRNLGGILTGVKLDISALTQAKAGYGSDELFPNVVFIGSQPLWYTSEGFDTVMKPSLLASGKVVLPFSIDFTTSSTGTAVNGGTVGKAEMTGYSGLTGTFSLGASVTGLVQDDNDYYVQPFAEAFYYNPIMDLVKIHYTYTPDTATGGQQFGFHKNATLLLESDGSAEQNALLSLICGVAQPGQGTGSVYYKVNGSDTWLLPNGISGNEASNYIYSDFSMAPDQYVTAVKIEYGDLTAAMASLGSVAFAVDRAILPTTRTGYAITDGEQLPFKLTFSYDNWLGKHTELQLTGVSSKLSITGDKLLTRFTPSVSYDSGSKENKNTVYQSANTTATVSLPFGFLTALRMGMDDSETWNKLQPVVYYVLAQNVKFISGKGTGGGNVTFASYPQTDGTTVVKATYHDVVDAENSPNTKVAMVLNITHGMPVGNQTPITRAYFDIPYEELNSRAERGYGISINPKSSQLAVLPDAWTFITKGDAKNQCLTANISNTVFVLQKKELGLMLNPTTIREDGSLFTGDYMTPAEGTAADHFGAVTTLMGDVKSPSANWNIYIPIAKKNTTVEYLDIDKADRMESAPSAFDMCLSGPIDLSSFPAGTTAAYTTGAFDPLNSALTGKADSAVYVPAAQITDWSKVTAVHINIPGMTAGQISTLKLAYEKVAKTEIGTQSAYSSMYYNYTDTVTNQPVFQGSVSYGVTTLAQYDLKDMYISGKVWEDARHNSLYDSRDRLWPGMTMKVSGVDENGTITKTYNQTAEIEAADSNLKATTGDDGAYTLAVPGYGTYIVEFTMPETVLAVTKNAPGGTVNNRSVFNPSGKTDILTMDASVEDHHLYNQNAGLYKVVLKAQNFSYGADETKPVTEEQAKKLAFAGVVGVDGNPVDLAAIKLDENQLKAVNDSLAAGELNKFPLTFTYTYDDGGTPDDPSDDKTVTNTIQVMLKDHGDGIVQTEDRLTADDASYGISNGAITAANLRRLVHADGVRKDGKVYLAAQITVNASDLQAMNDAITTGTAKPGDSFAIRLTSPDGTEVTSVITLRDKGTIASTMDYITADNFSYGKDEPELTADALKALSHVTGRDTDGFPYELSELTLKIPAQLEALNKALKDGTAGSKYPITYVTPAGTEVTVQVTLKDKGAQKNPEHITANNFSYPAANGELTAENAKLLSSVAATDRDGKPIDISKLLVKDDGRLKAINDALKTAPNGTGMPLTFTTESGTEVTVTVTLTKPETHEPGGGKPAQSYFTKDHIAYLYGFADGAIRPDEGMTRAQVAVVIYRLLSDETREANRVTVSAFPDVQHGSWYETAVATLSRMGIILGYSDGTFRPDELISRAQFAALFARFDSAEYTGGNKFSDIDGHWAANLINRAAVKGWVGGFADGSYHPNRDITRAEAATLVNRVLNRLPETTSDLSEKGMRTFTDNLDTAAWFYLAIQEATNSHTYVMKADNLHETWKSVVTVNMLPETIN